MNDLYRDPMFNPMAQYEQAYCYYRYLCMQMDYKIKCKEYEKMCNTSSNNERNSQMIILSREVYGCENNVYKMSVV